MTYPHKKFIKYPPGPGASLLKGNLANVTYSDHNIVIIFNVKL